MHQTFYIDIDEEITSIVDRLRKARTKEAVIVVPKRAMLIQSIVNLKLLKKEADELKKELIIVTQDKFGKLLIEKAGITVEQNLDDIGSAEISAAETREDEGVKAFMDMPENSREEKNKKRMSGIGSDGYYQTDIPENVAGHGEYMEEAALRKKGATEEKIINKELVTDVSEGLKKQKAILGGKFFRKASMDMIRNLEITESDNVAKDHQNDGYLKPKKKPSKSKSFTRDNFEDQKDMEKSIDRKKVKNFFENKKKNDYGDEYKSINIGRRARKYFFIFSLVASMAILGALAYLFLPKATVTIFAKNDIQTVDAQIQGDVNEQAVDAEKNIIPAKIVTVSQELSETYATTGKKSVSNQKARGTVTLYNEFSSSPQILVATTRIQSSGGKIFRLVSGVSVPGYQADGAGAVKPGIIEAEVVADESGSAYNIGPDSFTIPGFQADGTQKYSKIYAKSSKAMSGGGDGDQAASSVTDSDINAAKTKIMSELIPKAEQKLKDIAGSNYIILDDAVNTDDSTFTLSNSSGDIANNLTVDVKTNAKAIAFKKDDVNGILMNMIAQKSGRKLNMSQNSLNVEFGKSDVDFNSGTIIIRAHGSINMLPNINLTDLKNAVVGKSEDDLKAYLSAYSDIDHIAISYWPSFLTGKMPTYADRITIVLDNN